MTDQFQIQQQIAKALNVCPAFSDQAALVTEINRRVQFLKQTLLNSGLNSYVLGISGGVDSLVAGMLAQRAMKELRQETGDKRYIFIAVRLPYKIQADERAATEVVQVIGADKLEVVNIEAGVHGIVAATDCLQQLNVNSQDFVIGNIKARVRMVVQYAIAGAYKGLVIGTDHAAEAVMGFFTKFGDGACDLTPLAGLVKSQVRAIAAYLGAPEHLVNKVPIADLEELKPGQPDEIAHGVSYQDIDAFLHCQPVSKQAFTKITQTYYQSAHKRQLPITP